MANGKKRLQSAATKFRRENPNVHNAIYALIYGLANYIRKTGAPEVTIGITTYGEYYEHANE